MPGFGRQSMAGAEAGVGDQLTHRPVVGDDRQRAAARLFRPARPLAPMIGRLFGVVGVVVVWSSPGRQAQVSRHERSAVAARRLVTSVVEQVFFAPISRQGVLRVVLVEQIRRGSEQH